LRTLSQRFCGTKQAAIKCCLADIRPKKEYNSQYPQTALKEFKKLVVNTKHDLKLFVPRLVLASETTPVVIFLCPNNGNRININAWLVVKLKCAESTGDNSRKMISIDEDFVDKPKSELVVSEKTVGEKKTRVQVEILQIVSPSEFYVALKSRKNGKHKLKHKVFAI
jgi:hypothetical protein